VDYMECPLRGHGRVTYSRAVTISLLFSADPLGCQSQYKRKEGKGTKKETIILRMQSYEPIRNTTKWFSSMATFHGICRPGKIHLQLNDFEGGKNRCRRHLYRAVIQRRVEEKRGTRKHTNVIRPPYLHFQTEPILLRPSISVTRISWHRLLSEFSMVVELPPMIWHLWELPLPASVIAVNRIRQFRFIRPYLTRKFL